MRSVLVLLFSISLCHAHGEVDGPDRSCEAARRDNVWCAAEAVGYVAGVEIRSQVLFEALDLHGHHFEPTAIVCPACREALESDGFCQAHRIGFVRGMGYLTPLTYYLARGRRIDPEALECPACGEHSTGIGWCEAHGVGIAGLTAFEDRRDFDALNRSYDVLLKAVAMSARCETCAAAMMADGYCTVHKARYRDGELIPPAGS